MVEPTHLLGSLLALGAALAGAGQQLLIRVGTDEGRTNDAILTVMLVNLAVLVPVVGVVYFPAYGVTTQSLLAFLAAGVFGTLLGRICMFTSITRIGASRTAPVVAAWALISTLLGVLVLGESVSVPHAVGVVLVVGGVAAIAWETGQENPENLPRRELLLGLALPLGAAVAFGAEPIFAKFGFVEGTPAPVGVVVKIAGATAGFLLYLRRRGALPGRGVFAAAGRRWFALAGVANTLFLLGYYLSLAITPVSVVGPIVATNSMFVVALSAGFMPERLERVTWKLWVAATVVVAGVVLITAYG